MQLTQGLRRSRLLFPRKTATRFGERRTTWEELISRVARLAGGLAGLGARPGERVAILAHNSDRYIEAYFAIAWAGCVAVPFNTRWAKAEIAHAIDDSRPAIVLVDSAFEAKGRELAGQGLVVVGLDHLAAAGSCDALISTSAGASDADGGGDDLAGIFYTGGTTGASKGVMLSHANLLGNFMQHNALAPHFEDTVFLHTPPMFHMADATFIFGLTMLGATHVVLPGFEPIATLEAIEAHEISAMVLVPTMMGMLCEALAQRPTDVSSLRRVTYGASAISEALLERAMAAFPQAQFFQAYGQTELSPVATLLTHADHLAGRLRSAGRPVPGVDLRIVDETLEDLPSGSVGEVLAAGPGVMQGYWNRPDLTAQTIVDGWVRTGDAGYLDEDGYLFLVDRVKDMIVSGGENVYSAEVENALMSHPDVLQCAVIGAPDPRWGERVHAILYLRAGAQAQERDFIAHCEPLIANYKRPKSFELRDEPLPLSAAGKILKTTLREPFWKDEARNIGG